MLQQQQLITPNEQIQYVIADAVIPYRGNTFVAINYPL